MIKSKEILADDEYQRAVLSADVSNCTPFSGYLSRKSSKGFWQKRWFYLNNQFLIYKKDEITVENKGVLSLHEISSIRTTANVLEMTMSDGTYKLLLRGESNEEMRAWEGHIYERISWFNSKLEEDVITISYDHDGEDCEDASGVDTTSPPPPPTPPPPPLAPLMRRMSTPGKPGKIPLPPDSTSTTATSTSTTTNTRVARQLVVELVRGNNLIGCTKNGSSSPVVTLKLLGETGKEIPNECATSLPRPDTTQPSWEQLFVFGSKEIGINLSAISLPSLLLEVHHRPGDGLVVEDRPMGQVLVPLSRLDKDGGTLEQAFRLEKSGRMAAVTGELVLKLKWIKLPADKVKEVAASGATTATGEKPLAEGGGKQQVAVKGKAQERRGGEDSSLAVFATGRQYVHMDPNELVVTVFQCQNLRWTKKRGVPSPVVSLRINDNKRQRSVAAKTLNPVWNETFFFPVKDPSLSLTVTVEYSELVKNTFVGQTVVSLRPLQTKEVMSKQWFKLKNSFGEVSGGNLGSVELGLVWRFNPDIAGDKPTGRTVSVLRGLGLGSDSDTDVSDDDNDENTTTFNAAAVEASETVAAERARVNATLLAELGSVRLRSGDYQVLVHVLEVRELAAKNLNGLSDPVVFVEVNGEKQKTAACKDCLSAVFDELFIFNLKHMEKEELERIVINIKVFDANVLTKSVLIGALAVDLEAVYLRKDHEMYRQWGGLTNHEDPTATAYQGFLKYSIQVTGENDIAKVHDEQEENRKEEARRVVDGCPLVHVLPPPNVVKQWMFVVVAVYEADYLPVMDRSFLAFKKDGTDAYAELQFSSNNPIRTRVKTLKGSSREAMCHTFNYELWLPVSLPCASNHISFSMWDHDVSSNSLIGSHFSSLKRLLSLPRDPVTGQDCSTGLFWANIYGARNSTRDEVLESVKKGVTTAHAVLNNSSHRDYRAYYNRTPAVAPSYNGRVLISQRVVQQQDRPKKYLSENMEPFMRSIRKLNPLFSPAVKAYKLKALVVRGSDLPTYSTLKGEAVLNEAQKIQLSVCIGKHEIVSKVVKCVGRTCQWSELLESEELLLPEDPSQLPDIFVYLVTTFAEMSSHRDHICFKRIPVGEVMNRAYQGPCEWIQMSKDHCVDGIGARERPGSVLLKLGFGPVEVERKHRAEWESALMRQKRRTPYQVRVHLYQGKDFPATDDNGLCDPYMKFNLLGEVKTSSIKTMTRFPLYYETLIFDCLLPDSEFLPLIECQVYDKDILFDDFIGRFSFPLGDAFELENPGGELADPHYVPLFFEKPGDGQGEVLMSVQLLRKTDSGTLPPPPSLIPETRQAFIEITALGLRNMQPFKFQKMVSPFVEIFVQCIGGKHLIGTETSKTPSPSDPNYLEQFTLEVKLPRNALYAVPLMIVAKDVRMGGLMQPEVGVCYVDITSKIPWAKNYLPPQSNVFLQNALDMRDGFVCGEQQGEIGGEGVWKSEAEMHRGALDDVGKAALALQQRGEREAREDDFIVTGKALEEEVQRLVRRRMAEEDCGAGVFGALSHLPLPEYGGYRKKTADDYFADIDWEEEGGGSDEDDDGPPRYMRGRSVLDQELEKKLKNSPFESYKFCRGSKLGLFPSYKDNVGIFKGLVRVYLDADNPPLFDMSQLRSPQSYVCRLYVLRGLRLTPMDPGFGGRPGKSDPYLKVKLGGVIFDDRKNAVDDATDVDFYKMIEFGCELPGVSQLTVQVYDHDVIGSDDLIGETNIDLEDRWFDNKWQQIGAENREEPDGLAEVPPRWSTKDLERRTLYVPTSNASQGIVECWLDIMTPGEASAFPPDDVTLPPKQIFEVRLVVWKCKEVPAADTFGGQDMTDMYVKSWVEGCDSQETDTHWRAKKGKGSFNWRMKFEVELGHNTRAMKFPYMHLQLWDRDLLKWNDCMAEATINLGAYFRKAFKKQVAIKLFETQRGLARVKKNKKQAAKGKQRSKHKVNLKEFDIDDAPVPEPNEPQELRRVEREDLEEGGSDDEKGGPGDEEALSPSTLSTYFSYFRRKPTDYSAPGASSAEKKYNNKTRGEGESKPLLKHYGASEEQQHESGREDEDELGELELVKMIKDMTGLWDTDPDDSTWLFLDRLDHESGIREPMGKLCYGLQIWPKKLAVLMPAGSGQQTPNQGPFLPPPVGRLKFSWNPFVLGADLCGPALCFKICCCALCLGLALVMVFCQPLINVLIALFIR